MYMYLYVGEQKYQYANNNIARKKCMIGSYKCSFSAHFAQAALAVLVVSRLVPKTCPGQGFGQICQGFFFSRCKKVLELSTASPPRQAVTPLGKKLFCSAGLNAVPLFIARISAASSNV